MTKLSLRSCKGRVFMILGGIILVLLLSLYGCLDPEEYEIFPKCPMLMLTGFQCPSCGNQRALHALLNGDFFKACRYNFFAVYSVSYFLAVLLFYFLPIRSHAWIERMRKVVLSPTLAYLYIALYLFWWILRNILSL